MPLNNNPRLSKQNSFSFKTKINENTNSSTKTGRESLIKNNCAKDENEKLILEEIDVDVDQLIDANEPSASIIYFPSSHTKPMSNIVVDTSR